MLIVRGIISLPKIYPPGWTVPPADIRMMSHPLRHRLLVQVHRANSEHQREHSKRSDIDHHRDEIITRKRVANKISELDGWGAYHKYCLGAGKPFSKKCLGFIST